MVQIKVKATRLNAEDGSKLPSYSGERTLVFYLDEDSVEVAMEQYGGAVTEASRAASARDGYMFDSLKVEEISVMSNMYIYLPKPEGTQD